MEPWHLSENFKNVEIKLIFLVKKAVRKWKIIIRVYVAKVVQCSSYEKNIIFFGEFFFK